MWKDTTGVVTQVLLFACGYRGYVSWEPTGGVSVNSQRLPVTGKVVDGEVLLPVRAVAKAAGYDVNWVPGQGAVVVSQPGGGLVFSVLPGQDTAHTATGETGLSNA